MYRKILLILSLATFFGVVYGQDLGVPGLDYYKSSTSPQFIQSSDIDVLSTLSWTALATSVHAVSRSCCAFINVSGNDYIFQFGGGAGAQYTTTVRYDVAANTWSTGYASIPSNMSSASAVTVGDKIYLFGGESTGGLGKTFMYDPVANTWTAKANMLTLVTDALVVKFNDSYVYVIGGGTGLFGTGYFNNVQLYDVNANTYTQCTPYPVAAGMMGGGMLNYTIISAGGWDGTTGTPNAYKGEVNPSDLTQITWTPIANYPTGGVTRSASYTVSVGTYPSAAGVFFTGGAILGATITGATNFYNICTDSWESLTPALSVPRSNFKACGNSNDKVYAVAGFNGTAGVGNTDLATLSNIAGNCFTPVPVELTSFTAVSNQGIVDLNWTTATEINNQGFAIERRSESSEYSSIGFVAGSGTTTQPRSYTYQDKNLESGIYFYRLKQIDFSGTFEYSSEIEVDFQAPLTFDLSQNYPNPFNPSTNIKYSIPEAGNVRLSVFNVVGEEVAVLVNGFSQAGTFEVTFDASNLSTGVYLYKMQSTNFVQTKKMSLVK